MSSKDYPSFNSFNISYSIRPLIDTFQARALNALPFSKLFDGIREFYLKFCARFPSSCQGCSTHACLTSIWYPCHCSSTVSTNRFVFASIFHYITLILCLLYHLVTKLCYSIVFSIYRFVGISTLLEPLYFYLYVYIKLTLLSLS